MDRERAIEICERASKVVASWPEWKRNILQDSSSPTRRSPRPVIVNGVDPETGKTQFVYGVEK